MNSILKKFKRNIRISSLFVSHISYHPSVANTATVSTWTWCLRSSRHISNEADGEVKILNSFCSRPQQLSTYALTLYKHTATVGNKTVAVGMYCAIEFVLLSVTTGNHFSHLVSVCEAYVSGDVLFVVHRFLGHSWPGEISEYASLILPQSTRMHHGKTRSKCQYNCLAVNGIGFASTKGGTH